MERFLLFSWFEYEQYGGWNDFENSYPTELQCKMRMIAEGDKCYQIVDSLTGIVIFEKK